MPLSPYITFSGNCAAAIAFYRQTLGAELVHQITYGEMPQNAQDGCPSGQHLAADGIAHAPQEHVKESLRQYIPDLLLPELRLRSC